MKQMPIKSSTEDHGPLEEAISCLKDGILTCPENLRNLGAKVGKVVEIDFTGDGGGDWRRFTRIRIEVDYTKPLLPGVFLLRLNLNDLWISIKYEKISEICYNCGIIGHEEKNCQGETFVLQNFHGINFFAASSWLKLENDHIPTGAYQKSNKPQLELEAKLSCPFYSHASGAADTIHPV
nr:hypothetical protein CFP56_67926 [Quercus suber]